MGALQRELDPCTPALSYAIVPPGRKSGSRGPPNTPEPAPEMPQRNYFRSGGANPELPRRWGWTTRGSSRCHDEFARRKTYGMDAVHRDLDPCTLALSYAIVLPGRKSGGPDFGRILIGKAAKSSRKHYCIT